MTVTAHPRSDSEPESAGLSAVRGVLEVLSSGSGFLRSPAQGFQSSPDDVFVPQSIIRRFGLRTGDLVAGQAGASPGRGKSAPLERVDTVNQLAPEQARSRPDFGSLPAAYPNEQLKLECGLTRGRGRDFTNRVVDLIAPLGKGQRALIVAPARAGKTMLLQAILTGIAENHPDATLLVLLVDE
ncbi:MAG TPA: hypothetical protein VFI96_02465, partial [Longimicrobiaceae bacterium]|nr:hypothetical protein [Longimicrobiaceae bacterium]